MEGYFQDFLPFSEYKGEDDQYLRLELPTRGGTIVRVELLESLSYIRSRGPEYAWGCATTATMYNPHTTNPYEIAYEVTADQAREILGITEEQLKWLRSSGVLSGSEDRLWDTRRVMLERIYPGAWHMLNPTT